MALSRDIVIRLLGDADSAVKAQKSAADAAGVSATAYRRAEREFDRQAKAMETASRKQRAAMESVGRGAAVAGAAIVAGLGVAIKAAVDWESAWTGVLKTVDASPEQLAEIETGLRNLARTLPATHAEIAAVAEAAGQLGIEAGSIVDFTRVMVDLGETTNLTADEAATAIAQLMNVMGTSTDDVDELGSTLVALGNAGASTEADILSMAQRLSGVGTLIGASESDVLALASSMADLGIEAQLGGGVMTRVLQKIYSAALEGGDAIAGFAEVAGVSADEFAAAFQADPVQALSMFTSGLNDVQASGGNVVSTLADLGLKGTEEATVLLRMMGASDGLSNSLDTSSTAWAQNTALVEEAAKRYDTTAAKTEIARNALNDAAIEIGETFLPVLSDLAEGVADVAGWFADLPDPIKGVLGGLAGVAGVGALAGGAFLLLAPRVMDTFKAFRDLRAASPGVASGLGKVGKAAGIAGVFLAATSAVGGLVDAMGEAPPTMEETTDALLSLGESTKKVDGMLQLNSADVFGDEVNNIADAARELTDPSLLDRLDDFGGSLTSIVTFGGLGSSEGRAERDALVSQIGQMGDSLALMVESGNAELAAEQFDRLAEEWKRGGGTVAELRDLMPAYAEALAGVDNEQVAAEESARIQAESLALMTTQAGAAFVSLGAYAQALGLSEEETADLIERSNELGESLGLFVTPLETYTGMLQEKAQAEADAANALAEETGAQLTSWEDYVAGVDVSLDEYLVRLQQQVADQEAWQANMLLLAGRVSQGTLDELARMGPEGAALVADLVNASDAELQQFDDVTAARSKEAMDAWGEQLTLAQPVLAAIAAKGGKGAADAAAAELAAGTRTLAQIAADWGISIAGGLNPILSSLGKDLIRPGNGPNFATFWDGGYTGDGGKYEPKGVVHGGEYVITKERTAKLGVRNLENLERILPGYASGGFVSSADVPKPPSTAPFGPPLSTVADAAMANAYADVTEWLNTNLAGGGVFEGGTGLIAALQFARSQVGKPYIWAGVGPGGYDCSGFMSAVTNVIRGQSPYSRLGATSSFPWSGFAPGYGSFTIGSTPNAGGGIGHMAGTLLGVNVESAGGVGVRVGGSARGASDSLFGTRAHLASYRTGTPFVPHDGFAYLHRGERVVPAEFNRPTTGAASGGPVTVIAQFGSETIRAQAIRVVQNHSRTQGINARSWQ